MKVATLFVLVVECVVDTGPGVPLTSADLDGFILRAEPGLMTCANESCHGDSDRPLALFAPLLHRADPADLWRDEPLTQAEHVANLQAVLPFVDRQQPHRSLLVRKPLAPEDGGAAHRGGVQWWDADDPECEAVVAWIRSLSEVP